jgi:hypothetical protein
MRSQLHLSEARSDRAVRQICTRAIAKGCVQQSVEQAAVNQSHVAGTAFSYKPRPSWAG